MAVHGRPEREFSSAGIGRRVTRHCRTLASVEQNRRRRQSDIVATFAELAGDEQERVLQTAAAMLPGNIDPPHTWRSVWAWCRAVGQAMQAECVEPGAVGVA